MLEERWQVWSEGSAVTTNGSRARIVYSKPPARQAGLNSVWIYREKQDTKEEQVNGNIQR